MVSCVNCDHNCHCGNGGQCSICKCLNCEHNALDEFWKNLKEEEKNFYTFECSVRINTNPKLKERVVEIVKSDNMQKITR